MQAFVPKNRKPRFELIIRIIDLNNVPLSAGTAYVKWSLPLSTASEHHGVTDKAIIIDHRAYWRYEKALLVRLTIDRNQTLHECDILFEIFQEFGSGGRGDKSLLGRIRLNLAEYVDKSDNGEEITRRYLMQDSKVNSTLKVAIVMRQVEGERNYSTPPLKSAMVFGGIGGISGVVSSEQSDTTTDDLGRLPSLSTKSGEVSDMQDMYRRTLAASWNSRASDLPADKLIEDLFSGGSGWGKGSHSHSGRSGGNDASEEPLLNNNNDSDATHTVSANSRLLPSFEKRPRGGPSSHHFPRLPGKGEADSTTSPTTGHHRKTESMEQKLIDSVKAKVGRRRSASHEVSEFDVREDLRSWEISTKEGRQ